MRNWIAAGALAFALGCGSTTPKTTGSTSAIDITTIEGSMDMSVHEDGVTASFFNFNEEGALHIHIPGASYLTYGPQSIEVTEAQPSFDPALPYIEWFRIENDGWNHYSMVAGTISWNVVDDADPGADPHAATFTLSMTDVVFESNEPDLGDESIHVGLVSGAGYASMTIPAPLPTANELLADLAPDHSEVRYWANDLPAPTVTFVAENTQSGWGIFFDVGLSDIPFGGTAVWDESTASGRLLAFRTSDEGWWLSYRLESATVTVSEAGVAPGEAFDIQIENAVFRCDDAPAFTLEISSATVSAVVVQFD